MTTLIVYWIPSLLAGTISFPLFAHKHHIIKPVSGCLIGSLLVVLSADCFVLLRRPRNDVIGNLSFSFGDSLQLLCAKGEHTFTFCAKGFQDLVATVTLQAGVKSRFAFNLQEAVMEVRDDNTIAKAA